MPSLLSRLGRAFRSFGREVRGIPLPDHLWHDHYGIPHPFKPKESLEAYGDNVWLYAGVNKIAQEIARTKFTLRLNKGNGEFENVEKHDALDTLRKPQPIKGGKSTLTGMDLKYILGMHLGLNGEGLWVLQDRLRVSGAPKRIDPLVPGYVRLKTDSKTGDLVSYIYELPDRKIEIDPLDVVHFKLPSPGNWNRGHPPTKSIRYAVDTYSESEKMNLKRLQNNAVPGGILKTEASKIPPEERTRLREEWRQMYGGSDNAGKVAILTNNLDFQQTELSNNEMQFIEGKEVTRDEILANYGIGLEILGRTEAQTRSNAEAAIFVFQRFGVLFYLEKIIDTLNNDYLPAFPGTEKLEFTFDDPVPENLEEKRLNAAALMDSGALTPDEMRQMFGFDTLDIKGSTDVPYMSFNRIPIGSDPPDPKE